MGLEPTIFAMLLTGKQRLTIRPPRQMMKCRAPVGLKYTQNKFPEKSPTLPGCIYGDYTIVLDY